ncbi:hypothetical protein QYE76_027962 [Lolium multiflorum]|uniref:Uncharacterized protein n=1 Tax=Lolium multiflorum TaxID=4521 RepID=A0AAD8QNE1_LOLMU|nr:hypothetical protein QYE76_027962 [Lolium multiflorum]
MAEGTPVTYDDLTEELKKKYDEVKALLEADLIGFSRDHEASLSVRTSSRDVPRRDAHPVPSTAALALAAPSAEFTAYVVYKIGGDPSDYQLLA